MTDRPILFSAPMVRALLAGTKTQTRRGFSWPNPPEDGRSAYFDDGMKAWCWQTKHGQRGIGPIVGVRCAVGDRLYVREHWRTWAQYDDVAPSGLVAGTHVAYEATDSPNLGNNAGRFRQGMHMPRWASRIALTVTDVRVQRLQEISEVDAKAEGITALSNGRFHCGYDEEGQVTAKSPVTAYGWLWNSIHGEDAWMQNPWVAAYTFTVELCNIDQARAA